jgi:hypothetical protein
MLAPSRPPLERRRDRSEERLVVRVAPFAFVVSLLCRRDLTPEYARFERTMDERDGGGASPGAYVGEGSGMLSLHSGERTSGSSLTLAGTGASSRVYLRRSDGTSSPVE